MSEDEKRKIEPEGTPPIEAGGMVSEEDLMIKDAAEKARKGEGIEKLPDEKVLLLFIGEGIYDINKKLEELLDYFRKAGKTPSPKAPQINIKPEELETESSEVTKVGGSSPLEIAEGEDRVAEITEVFSKYSDKVTIDTGDAMFVVVKPRGYLKDDWSDINNLAKDLSGSWISQGKESHWKIPKIVKKTVVPKVESRPKPQGHPSSAEDIKLMFTKYLEDLLTFTEKEDKVIIKPKQFLGTENFTKIASVVREAGGEYVSAGAESHFKVPIGAK